MHQRLIGTILFLIMMGSSAIGRTEWERAGKCSTCGCDNPAATIVHKLSRQEFEITGMCQRCQNETFKSEKACRAYFRAERDPKTMRKKAQREYLQDAVWLAGVGDWIIKVHEGRYYPCKPDVFVKKYEKVVLK